MMKIIVTVFFFFSFFLGGGGNVLFNDALNTYYLWLYGVRHMVKDHSHWGGGGGEESESSLGQTKLFSHNHKFVADLLLIEMCLQVYKWYRLATRWTYDI